LGLAKKWADEWGIPVEVILASQDDVVPKAVVAPKHSLSWERLWSAKISLMISQQKKKIQSLNQARPAGPP
jgi:hypothetical protein